MAKITKADADLLELFAGKQEVAHIETRDDGDHIVFCERRYNPNTRTNETIDRSIRWSDFENIKDAFANVSQSLLPTDTDQQWWAWWILWVLWIREVKFRMEPSLKINDMLIFIRDSHTLCTADTTIDAITIQWLCEFALDELLKRRYVHAKYEEHRGLDIGGRIERHRVAIYSLTLTGKKVAEKIDMDTSAFIEPDIDDSPEEYYEWKPFVIDESDEIIVERIAPITLEDLKTIVLSKEDVEQAMYSASLRATMNAKNSNKKFRRWAMSKTGLGHMEIAKLENPENAARAEKGNKLAKEELKTEANNIRMQVKRMDESIMGKESVESSVKPNKSKESVEGNVKPNMGKKSVKKSTKTKNTPKSTSDGSQGTTEPHEKRNLTIVSRSLLERKNKEKR